MNLDPDAEKSRQRVLTCVSSESLRMQRARQQLLLATLIVDLQARLEWLLKQDAITRDSAPPSEALNAQRTLIDQAAQEAAAAQIGGA